MAKIALLVVAFASAVLLGYALSRTAWMQSSRAILQKPSPIPVAQEPNSEAAAAAVAMIRGVRVSTEVEDDMFPEHWRVPEVAPTAKALTPALRAEVMQQVEEALAVYPDRFLAKNLKHVHAMHSLHFFGLSYGGSADPTEKRVYITWQAWYPPQFARDTVHHELSSVLLWNHRPKFTGAWSALNSYDYVNDEGAVQAVREGNTALEYDERLHPEGFLYAYAKSSVEEDFNSIAEGMLRGSSEFWRIVDRYPKIRAKVTQAIDYYRSIDPIFTEEYLRGLVR
jgi:hypothetical protein